MLIFLADKDNLLDGLYQPPLSEGIDAGVAEFTPDDIV
jgi:hypothetical protein